MWDQDVHGVFQSTEYYVIDETLSRVYVLDGYEFVTIKSTLLHNYECSG